jgi:hypothetical protein
MLHRLWVLIGMICLLGYSVSASVIEIEVHGEEVEMDHTAVHCAAAFWLIIKLTRGECGRERKYSRSSSRALVLCLGAAQIPHIPVLERLCGSYPHVCLLGECTTSSDA